MSLLPAQVPKRSQPCEPGYEDVVRMPWVPAALCRHISVKHPGQ
jgi:hypothetical protein